MRKLETRWSIVIGGVRKTTDPQRHPVEKRAQEAPILPPTGPGFDFRPSHGHHHMFRCIRPSAKIACELTDSRQPAWIVMTFFGRADLPPPWTVAEVSCEDGGVN